MNTIEIKSGATYYRIATRERLTNEGFVFVAVSDSVDEYFKDEVHARFTHSPTDRFTHAHITTGNGGSVQIETGRFKLERALSALIGSSEKRWVISEADMQAMRQKYGSGDTYTVESTDTTRDELLALRDRLASLLDDLTELLG